ncbi:hypothetical protein MJI89_11425, partial [Salmonella enterica subsp. enterica serovar Montevideo]|nr:hypothetical protein [Salmonella enterica subsp. enterica serovar Montevideo]
AYKNGAALKDIAIPSDTHAYDLKLRSRAVATGLVMPGTIEGQGEVLGLQLLPDAGRCTVHSSREKGRSFPGKFTP